MVDQPTRDAIADKLEAQGRTSLGSLVRQGLADDSPAVEAYLDGGIPLAPDVLHDEPETPTPSVVDMGVVENVSDQVDMTEKVQDDDDAHRN